MASRHLGRGHRGHGWLGSESGAARDPAGGGVGVRERGRRVHGRHGRVAHAGHDVRDGAVVRGPALVRVDRALQSVAEVVGGRRRVSCRWCEDGQPAGRKARLRPRGQPQGLREQELRADQGKPHRELGRDQEVAAGAEIQRAKAEGANGTASRPRVSPRSKPRSCEGAKMAEQERINRNVNELSQKLLEGCKLLSDSCPETNVPLVSTKDGRMYSVGNGSYYVRDSAGELRKVGAEQPAAAEPSLLSSAAAGGSPGPAGSPRSSAPALASPSPAAEAEAQSLSARVAQKLLEGYTLLSDSCPHTNVPLVQSTAGQILSVGTNP